MRVLRFVPFALAIPLLVPSVAEACRHGGGGSNVVVQPIRPVVSRSEALIQAAQRAESQAMQEAFAAQQAAQKARQHRTFAVALRERARVFPDLDTETLHAQAAASEREAFQLETVSRTSSARAEAFRLQAQELRSLARQLAMGPKRHVI